TTTPQQLLGLFYLWSMWYISYILDQDQSCGADSSFGTFGRLISAKGLSKNLDLRVLRWTIKRGVINCCVLSCSFILNAFFIARQKSSIDSLEGINWRRPWINLLFASQLGSIK
ncbi:MAG: hypothetical protein ABIQ27_08385, partial [Flavobacterium sp.]